MSALLLRFLAVLGLLLMPFGMAAGPAMAHSAPAAGASSHCDESKDEKAPSKSADCLMACSALPAAAAVPNPGTAAAKAGQKRPTLASLVRGLQPEAATPPPKSL